ncbi:MAG: hypothetical protein NT161_03850 [Candidatus Nomurabacteria bacterium]|nr:hypothetical protein [Candidatus Nomurabacteria bacterium]
MKKIYEDIKKVFESKISTRILIGVGIVIVAMLIFSAGIFVGFHKASFGRDWGDNYERNFGMRPDRPMFGRDNFPNAHGATGKIIKVELPTIIVQDQDNTEKVILIKSDTQIQNWFTKQPRSNRSKTHQGNAVWYSCPSVNNGGTNKII